MKAKMQRVLQVALLGTAVLFSSGALAEKNNELLDILLQNDGISQQQYDDLTQSGADEEDILKVLRENSQISQEQYETLSKAAKEDESWGDQIEISLDDGFKVKTKDGNFEFQVIGRIMVDSAWYGNDNNNGQNLNDGTEIRRGRLGVKGTLWKVWDYKFEYDFAGSGSIKDAFLAYKGLEEYIGVPLEIKAGNFKETFGLEQLTSSRFIPFMERSLVTEALAPDRNLGAAINSYGDVLNGGWSAAVGVFGDNVNTTNRAGDETWGSSGRVTFAPIATKTTVVHFGGAADYRNLRGQEYRVRTRPESHIANHRLVDTGFFAADDKITWGVESAGVWGPLSVQGEYMQQRVDAPNGTTFEFDGYYVEASWFITGESRNYNAKYGVFKRLKPNSPLGQGGYGAFEVAARYSALDLNNKTIQGGNEHDWTVGLNWYPISHARLMFNYVNVTSTKYVDGVKEFNNPDIIEIRGQIDF
jgi:phosphate-selective porin OprO/OprP